MNTNEKFFKKGKGQVHQETGSYELSEEPTDGAYEEENEHTQIQPVLQGVERVPKNFDEIVRKQDADKERIQSLRQQLQTENAVTRKLRGMSTESDRKNVHNQGKMMKGEQTQRLEDLIEGVRTTKRIPITRQEHALNSLMMAADEGDREKMRKAVEIAAKAGFHIEDRIQRNPALLKNYALFQKQYQPTSIEREFQNMLGRATPEEVKNIVKRLYPDDMEKRQLAQKTNQYTKILNKLSPSELIRENTAPEAKRLMSATKLAPMTLSGLNKTQEKKGLWGKIKGFFGL